MTQFAVFKTGQDNVVTEPVYTPGGVPVFQRVVGRFQHEADAVEYAAWREEMHANNEEAKLI